MDSREEQEKLTKLVLRNDWGVKKAAEWARGVKRNDIESATDDADQMGPLAMLDMVDVMPLQTLRLRPDITESEIARLTLYMQLRNGMDREMLDYISEHFQFSYETLWELHCPS